MSLKIIKRAGDNVAFNPQKIYNRVKRSAKSLNVNSDEIFIKVITSVPTEGEITTKDLDKLIYEIAAAYTGSHHDYSRLASSVAISSYHSPSTWRHFSFRRLTAPSGSHSLRLHVSVYSRFSSVTFPIRLGGESS